MSITELDFQWFINNFYHNLSRMKADEKGFIRASEFKKVGSSSKNINAGQYRELMKLAVDRGFATDNGERPLHNKYAIRFNSSSKSNDVTLFDKDLLADRVLKFLPPLYLLEVNPDTGEITDGEDWKTHNIYWSSIIESLIVYENTGEFKTDFLFRDEQFFIIGVKKWVCVYEILKYGWNEIACTDPFKNKNYNDCFKCILMCASESHWRNRHKNLINRPPTQRKHLSNIKNNGVNEKYIKGLLVGMDWEPIDDVGRYAALNWLKDAAIHIQNDKVAEALKKLLETEQGRNDEVYKIVNRLSDPKRQENYVKKHNT
jgi:hypothetical protein